MIARNRNLIIMLGLSLTIGFLLAACDGRINGIWFSLETVSMLLLTLSYFFGAEVSENILEDFIATFAVMGIPTAIWVIFVKNDYYFGYTGGKIVGGALVMGGIMFAATALTRHQTGPLRAALGANLLPAFFGVAGTHRLISYFKDAGKFRIDFNDKLCVHGLLFCVFAIGVLIGANRKKLAKGEPYIAVAIWTGLFAVLHLIDAVNVPILK
ncbi:MAG: hypothetical protein IKO27_07400 [Ruminococcus sp.]|nr:hypothetical protein [Ruminococcus sp.]